MSTNKKQSTKTLWVDEETLETIDKYRGTKLPIPSKRDAAKQMIKERWEQVEKARKKKN